MGVDSYIELGHNFTDQRRGIGKYEGDEVIVYKYWFHEPDEQEVIIFQLEDDFDPRGDILQTWTGLSDKKADERFEKLLATTSIEEVPTGP